MVGMLPEAIIVISVNRNHDKAIVLNSLQGN